MESNAQGLNIAVVGAGISGITAAYLLSKKHRVTLFEQESYLGGHTNTKMVQDQDGNTLPVDTGFIVCNPLNYPNFYKLIAALGVGLKNSEMSFGYFCEQSGLHYVGPSIKEFLVTWRNIFKPDFIRLILEQRKFNSGLVSILHSGQLAGRTLKSYLTELGTSEYFEKNYLTPLIAAIWSSPDAHTLDFPLETFAHFFNNHGMLEFHKRPTWQTVIGGSHAYVKAFLSKFAGKAETNAKICAIERLDRGVNILLSNGKSALFDKVVIAAHADDALALLKRPSTEEQNILSLWRYNKNIATLHTDCKVLPMARKTWASWNYVRKVESSAHSELGITYYMNKLQRLDTRTDFFVTLNNSVDIDPKKILYQVAYSHPIFTPKIIDAQKELQKINGMQHTYFCGAHLGYGFHEDGVNSALQVASHFGLSL